MKNKKLILTLTFLLGFSLIATTNYADAKRSSGSIKNRSITNIKIRQKTLTNGEIAQGTITVNELSDGSVNSAKILDGSITGTDITDGTITNADVSDTAAINYNKLNLTESLTTNDIMNNTITSDDVSSISSNKISFTGNNVNLGTSGYLQFGDSGATPQFDYYSPYHELWVDNNDLSDAKIYVYGLIGSSPNSNPAPVTCNSLNEGYMYYYSTTHRFSVCTYQGGAYAWKDLDYVPATANERATDNSAKDDGSQFTNRRMNK